MHTHVTKDRKIAIHHNADWSGEVHVIAFSSGLESPGREVRLPGPAVLGGDYERPASCPLTERELRRATALAMYAWVRSEAAEAIEEIDAPEEL